MDGTEERACFDTALWRRARDTVGLELVDFGGVKKENEKLRGGGGGGGGGQLQRGRAVRKGLTKTLDE